MADVLSEGFLIRWVESELPLETVSQKPAVGGGRGIAPQVLPMPGSARAWAESTKNTPDVTVNYQLRTQDAGFFIYAWLTFMLKCELKGVFLLVRDSGFI